MTRKGNRTPDSTWTSAQLGAVLGCSAVAVSRYLSGERHPEVRMMKKIEHAFGWPAREQIDLIPMDKDQGEDLRYAMKFRQIINEWTAANPRTVAANQLRAALPRPGVDPGGRRKKEALEDVTKIT